MSDTPKRRFWQIHLSTAVIVSLATGAFLWANLALTITRQNASLIWGRQGWPLKFYEIIDDFDDETHQPFSYRQPYTDKNGVGVYFVNDNPARIVDGELVLIPKVERYAEMLAADVCICIALIGIIAIVSEHLIRDRPKA